jgi:ribonuclease BN (tRNA processing enzyme)
MSHDRPLDPASIADNAGTIGRRRFLRSATAVSGFAASVPVLTASGAAAADAVGPSPTPVPSKGMWLVLLGTAAGPVPFTGRTGVASALVLDGRIYLVDLGHGSFDQFHRAGLSPDNLAGVYITHMHSDHIADLYQLLWLRTGGFQPLTHPMNIYGPGRAGGLPTPYPPDRAVTTVNQSNPTPGLTDFINTSIEATAYDINIRMRDEAWPDIRTMVRPHDIALPEVGASPTGNLAPPMKPFTIVDDGHVKVSAILVHHPPVFPSYAFRFDTAYGSVVFSGDTSPTANMVTLARGADVLVHEAMELEVVKTVGQLNAEQLQHQENAHTDVTKLGPIAQEAGVKTLVLSHLVPGTTQLPDALWKEKAQRGFSGRVIVGRDLMRIRV